jgi:superfamily II DNA or RNA helicase
MQLRDYQTKCVEAVRETFAGGKMATLAVLPTGTGKTIIFGHVIGERLSIGRAKVIAHRTELLEQAAEKIRRITGEECGLEKAGDWVKERSTIWRPNVIVSSVQTQIARWTTNGEDRRRMERFNPNDFATLIIDEAHHAPAASYRQVIGHYQQNPALAVLGVTATPDRHDEEALGQIFTSVAFDYELPDAINDGWLVPIRQQFVIVKDLDFSGMSTTAGDLNGAELAAEMERERIMHEVVGPTIELAGERRTLVFTVSVRQAERTTEILNRHREGSARFVTGKTPDDERSAMMADYKQGNFQFLVNVGVATEGFDVPGIGCVAVARPTKSRALYAQMIGRGTRPLDGLVDPFPTADERRAAIGVSNKPDILVLDFVGNSGKHKLISTLDILGGNYSDDEVELAIRAAKTDGQPIDAMKALAKARHEEKLRSEQADESRRRAIKASAKYESRTVDPFNLLDIDAGRERGWDKTNPASEKQKALLEKWGVPLEKDISKRRAGQLIGELMKRWDMGLATYKQMKFLATKGINAKRMTKAEASAAFDAVKNNRWQATPELLSRYPIGELV